VLQQHQGGSPMISGSAGNRRSSSRARRIASSQSGARIRIVAAGRRIALVEEEVDHGGDGREALGALDAPGVSNGTFAAAIRPWRG
jgi:hypothetical protein